jgi:hypothetical protein
LWVSIARSERERERGKKENKKKRVIFGFQCLAMDIERLIKNLYSTFKH